MNFIFDYNNNEQILIRQKIFIFNQNLQKI